MRSLFLIALAIGLPVTAQQLSLQDALGSAFSRNPALAAAEYSKESAAARAEQANLDRFGRFDLSWQWAPVLKNPEFELPGIMPGADARRFELNLQGRNQVGITLDHPLWTWGSLAGRARAASLHLVAEDHGLARARQRIQFEVTLAYLNVRQALDSVGIAERAVAQQQAFLNTALAKVKAGQGPRLDALKAELAVSTAESELMAHRNGARIAREELVAATKDLRFRRADLGPTPTLSLPPGNEDDLVNLALRQRADLKAVAQVSKALKVDAEAARASGLPSLHLVGSLAQQNDNLSGLFQKENRTYLLGMALRWDRLSLKRAQARGAERAAQARQRQSEGETLEDRIVLEVRTAYLQVENAIAQMAMAAATLKQAEEQARVARIAYREGVITAVEAQDAELSLTRARHLILSTESARDQAIARVVWATGNI